MEFVKEYMIRRRLDEVTSIFTDLRLYGDYHPLIRSVDLVQNRSGGSKMFLIHERPFHWLPINIQYAAEITALENIIDYNISKVPLLRPSIRYELRSKSEKLTLITFNLKVEGFPIVRNILLSKMIKAQDALIESINNKNGA